MSLMLNIKNILKLPCNTFIIGKKQLMLAIPINEGVNYLSSVKAQYFIQVTVLFRKRAHMDFRVFNDLGT